MSVLTSKLFWTDAIERAVRTVAQGMVAVLSAGAIGILEADLLGALSVGSLAGLLSLLMSIAGSGNGNSASFVVDAKTKAAK